MSHDTAVAIFAKLPIAGKVKTRLTEDEIPGWGKVSLQQAATLYTAFLQDYVSRFAYTDLSLDAFFCVRPGTPFAAFQELVGREIAVVEEPMFQGKRAQSIGEAMSFTIKHFLAQGYQKVIILGSDLPHLPESMLLEAQRLLDEHPLVFGDDGGGCYLVSASCEPVVLESPKITWSVGQDFQQLCALQTKLGNTVGVLSEVWVDIDRASNLQDFCQLLLQRDDLRGSVPATSAVLERWGLL